MASTLATVRKETRRWARDTKRGDFAVGDRELNRIIESEMHAVGSRIRLGQAWALGVITLVANQNPPDYPLPAAGVQYGQLIQLRRASDKLLLAKCSQEQIQWMRRGVNAAQASYVSAYALMEDTTQTVTVMFDRVVTKADTIDLLRAVIPASLADQDSAAIPFDRDLIEAFAQGCALRAIDMMSPDQRSARGFQGWVVRGKYVPSAHAQQLARAYEAGIQEAKVRLWRLKMNTSRSALLMRDWFPMGLVPAR